MARQVAHWDLYLYKQSTLKLYLTELFYFSLDEILDHDLFAWANTGGPQIIVHSAKRKFRIAKRKTSGLKTPMQSR